MAETNGATLNGETSSHSAPKITQGDAAIDTGSTKRPRDARTVHLMLASMGITAYQERVPLALMDIAYRYTTSVIQDALLFWDAAHSATTTGQPPPAVTMTDLRMAITSKVNHQFVSAPPKEFMLDLAQERNKIALPPVKKEWGVRLPPEQYCLTGVNWELLVSDEEDGAGDEDDDDEDDNAGDMTITGGRDDTRDEEMPDAIADMFGEGGDEGDQDMGGA